MSEERRKRRPVSGLLGAQEEFDPSASNQDAARQVVEHVAAGVVKVGGTTQDFLEIETTHTRGPAPRTEGPKKIVEIWTRNRVYVLDSALICVEVVDRSSGEMSPEHSFLGRRLVGGQRRHHDDIELSFPYPRPGSEAVFEDPRGPKGQYWQTSTVARVVLRLHVITVTPNQVVPAWERLSELPGRI